MCIANPFESFMPRHLRKNRRTLPYQSAITRALTAAPLGVEMLEERCVLSVSAEGGIIDVSTDVAVSAFTPQVARDAAGNFVAVWQAGHTIRARRFDASGTALGGEFQVSTGVSGSSAVPSVAMAPDGRFVVSWVGEVSPQAFAIYARQFSADGVPLGSEFLAGASAASGFVLQSYPSVAVDDGGDFVIAWQDGMPLPGNVSNDVRVQRFAADGSRQGNEVQVNSAPTHAQSFPQVAMNPAGGFTVVWQEFQDSQTSHTRTVRAKWYSSTGIELSSVRVVAFSPTDLSADLKPHVAVNRAGVTTISWLQNSTMYLEEYSAQFTDQGSAGGYGPAGSSATLAYNYDGWLFYGWRQPDGTLRAQAPFLGGSVTGPAGAVVGTSEVPAIVTNNDGGFVLIWAQSGNKYSIRAQRFANDQLLQVRSFATDGAATVANGATLFSEAKELRLQLSRLPDLSGPGGPSSILNLANWQLLEGGNDITSSITSITLFGNELRVGLRRPLRGTAYTLTLKDEVTDTLGRALDGDASGGAGGDYSISFGVRQQVFGIGPQFVANEILASNAIETGTVGIGPRGDFIVGWNSARHYAPTGEPMGPEFSVGADSLRDVDIDSSGRSVTMSSGGLPFISVVGRNVDNQFLASNYANPSTPINRQASESAMDAAGNIAVVWIESGSAMYVQRLDRNLQKIGLPISVGSGLRSPINWVPAIAMDQSGDFVVTWAMPGLDATGNDIYAQQFHADGTANGGQFLVNSTTANDQARPHVAMDALGHFVVVWSAYTQSAPTNGVFGQWFDKDGQPVGGEQKLNTSAAGYCFPRVAMDARGSAIVVWSISNGTSLAQAFLPQGANFGDEFQLNQTSASGAIPFIAMNGAGEAIVSWVSKKNVFAQRLALPDGAFVDLNGSGLGQDYLTQHTAAGGPVAIVNADELYVADAAVTNLFSATISIAGYLSGDLLSVDTSGTGISASFADGVLSLSGDDTVAHYQQVLRTVRFDTSASRPASSTVEVTFVVNDGFYDSNLATSRIEIYLPGSAAIAARRLFYNDSGFDGHSSDMGPADDGAVPNKTAYLPGSGVATFASVSSYTKGINGIMIDLAGAHGEISLADFEFRVGTSPDPADWIAAPTPTGLLLRPGAGFGGADRLEITWPNNSIRNQWLEVRVKPNAHTGLASDDLFYWANRIGDVGAGTPANMFVTSAADSTAVVSQLGVAPLIDTPLDFNRDGLVTAVDKTIVMSSFGSLVRLNLGSTSATVAGDSGIASALASTPAKASNTSSLPTAQEPPRTAIAAEGLTRTVAPAELVTANTRAARLARAVDVALSLDDGWVEPEGPLVAELALGGSRDQGA